MQLASGDSSLALGMTWQLGGYKGEEVAIRDNVYLFEKYICESPLLHPHELFIKVVIPSASEESPTIFIGSDAI